MHDDLALTEKKTEQDIIERCRVDCEVSIVRKAASGCDCCEKNYE
jgi:hypothetical protein